MSSEWVMFKWENDLAHYWNFALLQPAYFFPTQPCPFCGGTDLSVVLLRPMTRGTLANPEELASYAVVCRHCTALGPQQDSVASARSAWDTRSFIDMEGSAHDND